jgi:GrpB-like predicted nucleotidyltransferase (UPF0157 family)
MIIKKYEMLPVVVRDYDPEITQAVEGLLKVIIDKIPAIHVEHIGSTSIPGCSGKGTIDLMVVYPKGCLEVIKQGLRGMGFQAQTIDNAFPEERPMRVGAISHNGKTIQIHVHVLEDDSMEITKYREFRDLLKGNVTLLERYVALKKQIVSQGVVDSVQYSELKSPFFTQLFEHG